MFNWIKEDCVEYNLVKNIINIPIDQRCEIIDIDKFYKNNSKVNVEIDVEPNRL